MYIYIYIWQAQDAFSFFWPSASAMTSLSGSAGVETAQLDCKIVASGRIIFREWPVLAIVSLGKARSEWASLRERYRSKPVSISALRLEYATLAQSWAQEQSDRGVETFVK